LFQFCCFALEPVPIWLAVQRTIRTARIRLQKNEMLIRIDDASKESRFHIKAMVLRPEWDRDQMLEEAAANAMISHHLDAVVVREQQP
jgi:hypothetical protein